MSTYVAELEHMPCNGMCAPDKTRHWRVSEYKNHTGGVEVWCCDECDHPTVRYIWRIPSHEIQRMAEKVAFIV